MYKIDLLGSKYFSDDQIDRLLQTDIRTRVSQEDELKAARLSRGTPTTDQQAFIDKVDAHIAHCIADAGQLRADSALLAATIRYEQAEARLSIPALDPTATDDAGNLLYPQVDDGEGNLVDNPAIVKDSAERAEAQAVVDATSQAAIDLAIQRKGA